ncbi:hypothetical protein [Streptomyces niveus]|uniref:hypothetical protein n=1 Tax=Streptomyces niveus TaxID=193462 RepID=UPI0036661E30
MPTVLIDALATSPRAFVALLVAVVVIVAIVAGTFLLAIRMTMRGVESGDKAATVSAIGTALTALAFWRKR